MDEGESAEHQLSPRVRLVAGDACKVEGKRGTWRFVRVWRQDGTLLADVIGPIGKQELLRTFPAARLKSAGRTSRAAVEMHAALRKMSRDAHDRRRL